MLLSCPLFSSEILESYEGPSVPETLRLFLELPLDYFATYLFQNLVMLLRFLLIQFLIQILPPGCTSGV